jgi:NADP-dependent 3-hydroxy acid dehydrogenase YdfG
MSAQHHSGGTALSGKIVWVTGAGSGVGEAAALLMARAGASVVLTGRRIEPLESVAARIISEGGTAMVAAGDVTDKTTASTVVAQIVARFGRLDILVNNAGMNIKNRKLAELTPDTVNEMVAGNLTGAYYNVLAALNVMRQQKDGVLIHTASWAGKYISQISGSTYSTAKAAVIAMSETINVEEFRNGIRSSVLCPNEIATPILDKRPVKVTDEERARMLQMEDMGNLIVYIASQPPHVCINEVVISPTWNRFYEKMI